jgi:uncharacterized protein YgiM (DUF1202 family)
MKGIHYIIGAVVLIVAVCVIYFWDYLKNKISNVGKSEEQQLAPEPTASFTSGGLPEPKSFNPGSSVYVTASKVNLREGPGTDKKILSTTAKNDYWYILKSDNGWIQICNEKPLFAYTIQASNSNFVAPYGAKVYWAYSAYFEKSSFTAGGGGSW